MKAERLRVGVISSVHGIKGECKVFPTTDDAGRFSRLKTVYATDPAGHESELSVSGVRFFKNMVIVKFDGIDTPEEMQKLRGRDLYIDRKDAVPLKKNENYIADLIGLEVRDEDDVLVGHVKDIFPTGANQVMDVTRPDGTSVLIPYIGICILDVLLDEGYIRVHMLEGL